MIRALRLISSQETKLIAPPFGVYAIWGERGALAFETAQAEIGVNREQLAQLEERSSELRHSITLMSQPAVDLDLVEELARDRLMAGEPHQVAIARDVH